MNIVPIFIVIIDPISIMNTARIFMNIFRMFIINIVPIFIVNIVPISID